MKGLLPRLGWLGVIGLALGVGSGETQAWDRPPVKVDTVFQFRVEVNVGPQIGRPTAPWYAYFPADPRMMPSPQLSPYPPWPAQFPPASPPSDPVKGAQKRDASVTPGPALTQHTLTQYWSSPIGHGPYLQPVGYVPTQMPSYWYQNR